jgi:DNA sulfur modification protein DndE
MKKIILAFVVGIATGTLLAESTIWIIGDSTVNVTDRDTKRYPQSGWGQHLRQYCKSGVKVDNRAIGGRSAKSFIAEKRWERMLPLMKKGDFLFIQFGHNDQKKYDKTRYAPADSLYQELLKKFIAEAKEKGVSTILVTPVYRRKFRKGKLINSLGDYPAAVKKVGKETVTPVVDLHKISFDKFSKIGEEGTKKIFLHLPPGESKNFPKGKTDNTHFNVNGATIIAGWIVADIKGQKLKVAEFFK